MSEAQNTQSVKDAYAAFGRGDVNAILAMVDDSVEWEGVKGAEGASVPVAVARLTLSDGRLGCLLAAAPAAGHVFPERKLRLLAGIADQATLALNR